MKKKKAEKEEALEADADAKVEAETEEAGTLTAVSSMQEHEMVELGVDKETAIGIAENDEEDNDNRNHQHGDDSDEGDSSGPELGDVIAITDPNYENIESPKKENQGKKKNETKKEQKKKGEKDIEKQTIKRETGVRHKNPTKQDMGVRPYIQIFKDLAQAHRSDPVTFAWAQGGDYYSFEESLALGSGYPAFVAVSVNKMKYAPLTGSFSQKNIESFIRSLIAGKQSLFTLREAPKVSSVTAWDGKDAQPQAHDSIEL